VTLADQIAVDFAALGKAITYDGSSINAIVKYGKHQEKSNEGTVTDATIMVLTADVPSPAYRDPVEIDATDWSVKEVEEGNGYTWRLKLVRDERTAFRR
jgi:hypothetical protein